MENIVLVACWALVVFLVGHLTGLLFDFTAIRVGDIVQAIGDESTFFCGRVRVGDVGYVVDVGSEPSSRSIGVDWAARWEVILVMAAPKTVVAHLSRCPNSNSSSPRTIKQRFHYRI